MAKSEASPPLVETEPKVRTGRWLPRSLFSHLGMQGDMPSLPRRVQQLIVDQEARSERLITYVQLTVVLIFGLLYFIAPKPADAALTMFEPVPLILGPYFLFTLLRLYLVHRDFAPGWFLVLSMLIDVGMLWTLLWSFHIDYGQPAAFYLKIPMFAYIFVFISIRALRFDPRFVLSMGAFAAIGWIIVVAYALDDGGEEVITRNFVDYMTGPYVLIGAEFDKVFTLVVVTAVLSLAVFRARRMLVTAVREEAAGRQLRRFLSEGVADAVTDAEIEVAAGRAEARDAAILMLDVRGFTSFASQRTPADVVKMLTRFHARAIPLIQRRGGVVDKFMGDGIMATFGAVTPSPTAARNGLEALEDVIGEAADWAEAGEAGLAVNGSVVAGPVVFAALGHGNRLEYTVIGAAANLAAKLEKHNKLEGSRALTDAPTFERALSEGFAPARPTEQRPAREVAGVDGTLDLVSIAG